MLEWLSAMENLPELFATHTWFWVASGICLLLNIDL